jgi:glutamate-1-semialdehyde 2,1-aminomutase
MTDFPSSHALFQRASAVIPGGLYGHTQPAATLPGVFPYFAASASGARFRDVDGREYLDFMCGYGPVVLGHADPALEDAVAGVRSRGLCFSLPSEPLVELAEELTRRIDFADWAVFGKNGSDMTTWALQVAREATGRRKILHIKGVYHGVDAWITPGHGGIIPEDRSHIHSFPWNDADGAAKLFEQFRGDIAAVFVTPYHHPSYAASEFAQPAFFPRLRQLCDEANALLILDDIRVGFRLHNGGSHIPFGLRPDLSCYCKAMANGYAISACVGREPFRKAARQVFLTGSYWNDPVALTAALYTLKRLETENIPDHLERMGQRLAVGLKTAAAEVGLGFELTGPGTAPYPIFHDDANLFKIQKFCAAALKQGLFFHPHHNWFLCAAHTEGEIDEAIERAKPAFAEAAAREGSR